MERCGTLMSVLSCGIVCHGCSNIEADLYNGFTPGSGTTNSFDAGGGFNDLIRIFEQDYIRLLC
jgi:hypothetical protein